MYNILESIRRARYLALTLYYIIQDSPHMETYHHIPLYPNAYGNFSDREQQKFSNWDCYECLNHQ